MTSEELPIVAKTVQDVHLWLKDLSSMLQWDDRRRAHRLLRAVLHVLRDRLPLNELGHLGAQLPTYFRGVYYEGWSPNAPLSGLRRKSEFVTAVAAHFANESMEDAELATRVALEFLSRQISPGEMEDVKACMPDDIKQLWP